MAYTDLFNVTIDNLATKLAEVTGLRVVTDPRNLNAPCVFLDAPSFEAFNNNIVKMRFSCVVLSSGPSNLDALRNMLSLAAGMLAKGVAVTDGNPSNTMIGGVEYPSYTVNISIQAATSGG
jgi:hypothetical protein